MALVAGSRFGPYEIIAKIGAGGMGEVYRAKDIRLNRTVAIKVLPASIAPTPQMRSQFEREGKAIARLSHPHICALYDVGHQDGIDFLVMEYLEGETLAARLSKGSLPFDQVLQYGVQLAEALERAHVGGIIHRDLKPGNVVLTVDGAKILDFGLASMEQHSLKLDVASEQVNETASMATVPGMIKGTFGYMAPEQIRGDSVTPAVDIFSLGCVLYEMLCGRPPFEKDKRVDVLAATLAEQPPPISGRVKGVPAGLESAISRCLRKEPAERFQSAREVAEALAVCRQTSSSATASYLQRRAILGILLTLVIMAAIAAAVRLLRSTDAQSFAVMPLGNDTGKPELEYVSDGITEEVIGDMSLLPALRVMARSTVLRYKGRTVDAREIGRELNVQRVAIGHVSARGNSLIARIEFVNAVDGGLLWTATYERPADDLRGLQQDISSGLAEQLRPHHRSGRPAKAAVNAQAYSLYLQGRYYWNKRTVDGLKTAIEYFEQALKADPSSALPHVGIADCYMLLAGVLPPRDAFGQSSAGRSRRYR